MAKVVRNFPRSLNFFFLVEAEARDFPKSNSNLHENLSLDARCWETAIWREEEKDRILIHCYNIIIWFRARKKSPEEEDEGSQKQIEGHFCFSCSPQTDFLSPSLVSPLFLQFNLMFACFKKLSSSLVWILVRENGKKATDSFSEKGKRQIQRFEWRKRRLSRNLIMTNEILIYKWCTLQRMFLYPKKLEMYVCDSFFFLYNYYSLTRRREEEATRIRTKRRKTNPHLIFLPAFPKKLQRGIHICIHSKPSRIELLKEPSPVSDL